MKNQLLLILSIFFVISSKSQTVVSGFISSNTTWNIDGSPYVITSNILINNGATLTIEPGVNVLIDQEKSILCNGEIIAIGNTNEKITFTSNGNGSRGYWGYLSFSNTSSSAVIEDDTTYISGSILKNVIIEYGGYNANGMVIVDGAPFIDSCEVRYSSASGIFSDNIASKITIINSDIHGNDGVSSNNFGGGISLRYSNYKVYLANNKIHNNNGSGGLSVINNSTQSIIKNNTIYNNEGNFGYGGGVFAMNPTRILGNRIYNNNSGYGGGICVDGAGANDDVIANNYIAHNTANEGGAIWGITDSIMNNYIYSNISANDIIKTYKDAVVLGNRIENNTSPVIYKLYGGNNMIEFLLISNLFENNSNGSNQVGMVTSFKNENSGTDNIISLKYNSFIEDSVEFFINQDNGNTSYVINADSNYFEISGDTSVTNIEDYVNHFIDNPNNGIVNISNTLESPHFSAPIDSSKLLMSDTCFITIKDTVIIEITDTLWYNDTVYTSIYDTVFVEVFDTVYTEETIYTEVYDTTYINVYDTISVSVHDTLVVNLTSVNTPNQPVNKVKIFPNPAANILNIEFGSPGNFTITIFSISGQTVFTQTNVNDLLQIDISDFNIGQYIISLSDNDGNFIGVEKIIVLE